MNVGSKLHPKKTIDKLTIFIVNFQPTTAVEKLTMSRCQFLFDFPQFVRKEASSFQIHNGSIVFFYNKIHNSPVVNFSTVFLSEWLAFFVTCFFYVHETLASKNRDKFAAFAGCQANFYT
jgi:hypothetical protein